MTAFGVTRLILQIFGLITATITLGLAAYVQGLTNPGYFVWNILALTVSILTIIVLLPVLIADRVHKNAVISWTSVELSWLGVLWMLWLATAGYMRYMFGAGTCVSNPACNANAACRANLAICRKLLTLEAFSFITWITLMSLFVYELVYAIRASSAGNRGIWRSSAAHFDVTPASDGLLTNEKTAAPRTSEAHSDPVATPAASSADLEDSRRARVTPWEYSGTAEA